MRKKTIAFELFLLVLCLAFVLAALRYGPEARMMPLLIGIAGLCAFVLIIINEFHPLRWVAAMDFGLMDAFVDKKGRKISKESASGEKLWVILLWILGLFLIVFLAGFHVGIVAFCLLYLRYKARVGWVKAAVGSLVLWAAVFLIFQVAMDFELFKGVLFGEFVPGI